MNLRKILSLILALSVIITANTSAFAEWIVLRGTASGSVNEHIAVGLYKSTADVNNITASDVIYLDQTATDENGNWSIKIPFDFNSLNGEKIVTNASSYTTKERGGAVYVSPLGSDSEDGKTPETAVQSLEKAIDIIEDGTVYISGTLQLGEDFVWQDSDKTITVSGVDSSAVLDISDVSEFQIGCNAVFENITINMENDGSGTSANTIFANGNHVVINDSVNMNIPAIIYGGSNSKIINSTNLELYGGKYMSIYAGSLNQEILGDCTLTVGGDVNSEYSVKDSDKTFIASSVNGGGWECVIGGDCIINLQDNIKFAYVYGGSQGKRLAKVKGKSYVNISGGSYMNVFACYNTVSNAQTNAILTMTGGTAEAVFGGGIGMIYGSTQLHLSGGTVSRRVYGGCYNDYYPSWESDNYVSGSIGIAIGKNMNLPLSYDINRGLFGGSRTETNHSDEISTIVFLDDTYDTLKSKLGDLSGWDDELKSHHDYIVAAGNNGGVEFVPNSTDSIIKLVPDNNYKAAVNGADYSQSTYTLTSDVTNITFEKIIGINNIDMTYTDGQADFTVSSQLSEEQSTVIVALYDGERLIGTSINDGKNMDGISIPCVLESKKTYKIKAFVWNDTNTMFPVCELYIKTIINN